MFKYIERAKYQTLQTLPNAPDPLLEIVKCTCKTGCKMQRCSCTRAQQKCSDLCSCESCSNIVELDKHIIQTANDANLVGNNGNVSDELLVM